MKRALLLLIGAAMLAGCTATSPGPATAARFPGRLAYPRDGQIYIQDGNAGRESAVGFGYGPAWSGDGQWLAYFGSEKRDGTYGLRLVKRDGTGMVPFPTLPPGDVIAWSPVAPVLAVGTEKGLWLVRPDGSANALVAHPQGIRSFAWSPDGKRFLATTGGGRMAWFGKSLAICDTRACTSLPMPMGTVDLDGVWAPTGDRIAFVRAEMRTGADGSQGWQETRTLWVSGVDGSGARELKAAGTGVYSPMWAKDGKHLLYARGEELFLIDTEDGAPVTVARFSPTPDQGYYGQMSAPVVWSQTRGE